MDGEGPENGVNYGQGYGGGAKGGSCQHCYDGLPGVILMSFVN